MRLLHILIQLFLFKLTIISTIAAATEVEVAIKDGILDLRSIDLSQNIASAHGVWLFKYNKFVEPNEVDAINWDRQETFKRKGGWNKQKNFTNYPDRGYGTYFIRVLISENNKDDTTGILLRLVKTSGKLYLNGRLVDRSGIPGINKETTSSLQKPLIGLASGNEIHVLIHVSNFDFNRGGIDENIYISNYSNIMDKVKGSTALLMFSCGALILVGLYHGILFLIRQKNIEILLFSVFSIAIAIRMLLLVDKPYLMLVDTIDANLALSLEFWTVFFSMPLLYSYYYFIFPSIFNKRISLLYIFISLLICLLTVLIDSYNYSKLIPVFEGYILLTYLLILYGLSVAAFRNQRYSLLFLSTFLIIFLGSLNDILYERGVIRGGFIIQYAIFFFIICQAILIGKRFSDAETKLSILVEEQTKKLKEAVIEAEKSHNEVRQLSNSIMNLLEEERKHISRELHDDFGQTIRAAGLYADSIAKHVQSNNEIDRFSVSDMALKISKALMELYNKNRNLLKKLRPEIIDTLGLRSAIEELLADYRNNGFNIEFICTADLNLIDSKQKITIYRILQEAMTNILKYSNSKDVIVAINQIHNNLIFVVKDNGCGFDVSSAKGIGLISMRERLSEIGGNLKIDSEKDVGTTIHATIPIFTKS